MAAWPTRPPPSLRCRRAAPHLHRTPAGGLLRRPPGRGPGRRAARLRRLLPVRPLPGDGALRRPAGPDGCLDHAGRAGPRDLHDPPRHARHVGHLPLPRSARDRRGGGRPDERRPGRARPRCGLVRGRARRVRHPVPVPRRALRAPRGAARHRQRAVGEPDRREVLVHRPPLRRSRTPRACPSPCSSPPRRSSSAATARPARPASPPATQPSSTWPSRRSRSSTSSARASAPRARPSTATRPHSCARPRSSCAAGRTRPSSAGARPPSAATPDELREHGAAGLVPEVAATLDRWRQAGAERLYLQVLDLSDLEHLELVAAEVVTQLP